MRQEAMEEVLKARQVAREAVLAAREREQLLMTAQRKAKAEWFAELQTRATEARLVRPYNVPYHMYQ